MTCRLGGGIRLGWPVYPRPLTRGMCCAEWAAHPCLRQHAWLSPACSLRAGALCLRRRRPQRTPTLGHVRLTLQHCVVAGLACQSTSRLPAPPLQMCPVSNRQHCVACIKPLSERTLVRAPLCARSQELDAAAPAVRLQRPGAGARLDFVETVESYGVSMFSGAWRHVWS